MRHRLVFRQHPQTAYNRYFLKIALPLMRLVFPAPAKACLPIVHALLEGQNGQLAEPGGPFHIRGKPRLVPLYKRI